MNASRGPHTSSTAQLKEIRDELRWLDNWPVVPTKRLMVFSKNPSVSGPYVPPTMEDILDFNWGTYSLQSHCNVNQPYLTVESMFCSIISSLNSCVDGDEDDRTRLLAEAYDGLIRINHQKGIQWSQQRIDRDSSGKRTITVNTEPYFYRKGVDCDTVRAASLVALLLDHVHFISRRASKIVLSGIRDIIHLRSPSSIKPNIPRDPRTTSSQFNLEPVTSQHVCCPNCHFLYPYEAGDNPHDPQNSVARSCTNIPSSTRNICGTPLWKDQAVTGLRTTAVPIKKYMHQDFKSWIGRLLSRKGVEDLMETPPLPSVSGTVDDILLSKLLASLKDVTGEPFYPGNGDELHLIFSISVDSFDAFGNKTASQTVSSTGVWLTILNLPWHLRHLRGYTYLAGVIPGPKKPSTDEINHYIQLVVDELLQLWDPGVFFSRTYKHALGRLVRAMLVTVVCDMLAARQLIGYASSPRSHYLCMCCDLDYDDINILERKEWPRKRLADVRRFAQLWRDLKDPTHRKSAFEAFGWRWTPLFDLPYFDPIQFTVIDTMHALHLGLLQTHCRQLFRIDVDHIGGDALLDPVESGTIQKPLNKRCMELIRINDDELLYQLLNFERPVLYAICRYFDIRADGQKLVLGTRWILAQNIYAWRRKMEDTTVLEIWMDESLEVDGMDDDDSAGSDDQAEESSEENYTDEEEGSQNEEVNDLDDGSSNEAQNSKKLDRVIRNLLKGDGDGELSEADLSLRRERAFRQASKPIYRRICELIAVRVHEKATKKDLHQAIVQAIDGDNACHALLGSHLSPMNVHGAVLGKDVMKRVWQDMTRCRLPSWISPAPPNWGTTTRGKLSADNWKVICTVHLPVTLIWVWRAETARKRELLDNFMDLVTAVRLANMRVTSSEQIQAYDLHIFRYVGKLRSLFSLDKLRPNHHASLHVGDNLGAFGPSHARSASFYERHIAFFHRINTNRKIGQLDQSILRSSARSANLSALISDDEDIRVKMAELFSTMESVEQEDLRGFQLAATLDPTSSTTHECSGTLSTLSEKELILLRRKLCLNAEDSISDQILHVDNISLRGVCYATNGSRKYRDSTIIFSVKEHQSILPGRVGIVENIFKHTMCCDGLEVSRWYLTVQEYSRVNRPGFIDPYLRYGFAAGFLCEEEPCNTHVIELDDVESHFVMTSLPDARAKHVHPVNQLMTSFGASEEGCVFAHAEYTH